MKTKCAAVMAAGAAFLLLVTGGCTYYCDGYLGQTSTDVQLSQANFHVVKSVAGSAGATYWFGIGPTRQDLVGHARRDMLTNAGLTGSQAVVYLTTDVQAKGFMFWRQKKVYVSAEVVEFAK
jgi:hypothetical protein